MCKMHIKLDLYNQSVDTRLERLFFFFLDFQEYKYLLHLVLQYWIVFAVPISWDIYDTLPFIKRKLMFISPLTWQRLDNSFINLFVSFWKETSFIQFPCHIRDR